MKFSVSSNDLIKFMNNVSGVIPQKSTLPILESFLFDLSKDQLKITATDLDISMSVNMRVKGMANGKIAIPGKRLLETIRSLSNTELCIDADTGNNKILMLTENGEYRLTGESFENFPTFKESVKLEEIKIETERLKRLISKTSFAVSSDELRPAMMGILIQMNKGVIRAVSTDGHRLAKIENRNIDYKIDKDIIIPVKALNLVLKSINEKESNIAFDETHTMFKMDNITLISKMIEEKYPNYESVIPLDNDKKLVVDKNQLLSSVRRTSLYASSTTHQVRLSIRGSNLVISAEDIDFGSEAKETIKCDYSSEPMEVGFNSLYLIDILSHIDTDEVILLFNSPTRACIVQPATQREDENLLMLLMPVRLNV